MVNVSGTLLACQRPVQKILKSAKSVELRSLEVRPHVKKGDSHLLDVNWPGVL